MMEEQQHEGDIGRSKPEELLYHYTDQKGLLGDQKELLGILKSDCVWATHYRFLNDRSERQEAVDLFSQRINQQANSPNSPWAWMLSGEIRKKYWGSIQKELNRILQLTDAYFVSFTKEDIDPDLPLDSQMIGDNLSQWRGYGQSRQGFSLGFNGDRLMNRVDQLTRTSKTSMSADLWKCIYGEGLQNAIIGTCLGICGEEIRALGNLANHSNEQDIGELSPLKKKCHEWAATFKHHGFKEEHEWRLVLQTLVDHPDVDVLRFREGRFGRTPYIQVPLGLKDQDSPLERIVVGPSQNKDQVIASLDLELKKMGIQGVEIVASRIPYREG
jgi:hypothetical protein